MRAVITQADIPGGWSDRDVTVAGRQFNLLLPADADSFLNDDVDQSSPALRDPYWAELWPTALAMAEFVLQREWPAGTRAIELGCGSGLVGLAGLAAGLDITFSDYVPLAVDLAVENAQRNGFPNANGIVLDWRDPPDLQFPIALASDVLYDRELHTPLLDALHVLLTDNGVCWLGEPGRSTADSFFSLVASTRRFRLADEITDGSTRVSKLMRARAEVPG